LLKIQCNFFCQKSHIVFKQYFEFLSFHKQSVSEHYRQRSSIAEGGD
jgi:hypothetical protein